MMPIYEYQAKKLYIKRADLERALSIEIPSDLKFLRINNSKPIADYLKPYALMPFFTLDESVALLLGLNPSEFYSNHYLFKPTKNLLVRAIADKQINVTNTEQADEPKIEHRELAQWAINNNYQWELPPYKKIMFRYNEKLAIEAENTGIITVLEQQLDQANATIKELQARITELENQKQVETQKIAEPKQARIQRHHRALFALLVNKNYKGFDTRNSLFNAINADLKLNGITSDETKFDTYNKLIDNDLFKRLEIFPNKKR